MTFNNAIKMAANNDFGLAMNAQACGTALSVAPDFQQLFCRNLAVEPYYGNFDDDDILALTCLIIHARCQENRRACNPARRMAQAITELAMPFMADHPRCLNQHNSRLVVIAAGDWCLAQIRAGQAILTCTLTEADIPHGLQLVDNILQPLQEANALANVLPVANAHFAIEGAINFLRYLVATMPNITPRNQIYCYGMISLAKQGSVTDAFIEKAAIAIQADLAINLRIEAPIVNMVWSNLKTVVTGNNVQALVTHYLEIVPVHATALRIIVNQAASSGLTTFITIGRAIRMYPEFQWGIASLILPGEMASFNNAVAAVNNNRYYGYNPELQAVRSTLFKNLGWVAKEMLVRGNGEVALNRYAGWIRAPKNRIALEELIVTALAGLVPGEGNVGVLPNIPVEHDIFQ